jgi:hypothetical protein
MTPHGFRHLVPSINIETTGSHVPHWNLKLDSCPIYAASPVAIHQANTTVFHERGTDPRFRLGFKFSTPHMGFLFITFPIHTCPVSWTFPQTLRTTALNSSPSGWFRACSWKPILESLPPSSVQHERLLRFAALISDIFLHGTLSLI